MSYISRMMGYMDTSQWRQEGLQRAGRGYVASSTEARDIEGSQPAKPYVRTRVPRHHQPPPPEGRHGGERGHLGNNYIQRARRRHMYERKPGGAFVQPEIVGSKPRRMVKQIDRGVYANDEPIEGSRPNPHFHGHDGTLFDANRREAQDPLDPEFERLGRMGAAHPFERPAGADDPSATSPRAVLRMPREAPFAPDMPSAFEPAPPPRAANRPDRQMDITDIDGSRPQIQPAYRYQQRDLMKNDDVEGATTWNWKPLHRRFIGGGHAPRALNADDAAPKLGPTTGLPSHVVEGGGRGGGGAQYGRRAQESSAMMNRTAGLAKFGRRAGGGGGGEGEHWSRTAVAPPAPAPRERVPISQVF
jgi:hypothetical protein